MALNSGPINLAHRPLAGRRVVVTRPQAQAAGLAERLAALGATPILLPVITIEPASDPGPLDEAIGRLGRYDWIVFTSANGVAIFWQRLAAAGLGQSALDGVRLAAIGPATAAALAERGRQPDFVPTEYVAEQIAAGLGDVTGQAILLPRAELARPALAEMLAAAGARVEEIATYQSAPVEPAEAALAELVAGVDAITFTSSSTVHAFCELIQRRLGDGPSRALLTGAVIACIGPITAATARERGLEPAVIAREYTADGLAKALAEHFS
jgi:uroporphyrinogen III methyltransferase/synthase